MKEVAISLKICKCKNAEKFVRIAIQKFIDKIDH